MRTCVGCRRRAPQHELVRLARRKDGEVVVDRRAPGRGAWLCADGVACLQRALRHRSLQRAFRAPVNDDAAAALLMSFGQQSSDVADLHAAGSAGDAQTKG